MKVLLTGSNGAIGSKVYEMLQNEGHDVETMDINGPATYVMDIQDEYALERLISKASDYDCLINCLGVGTRQGTNKERVMVNGYCLGSLVEGFYNNMKPDSRIITISTSRVGVFFEENRIVESDMIWYYASKTLFDNITSRLVSSRNRPVYICNIEPDWVFTPASTSHMDHWKNESGEVKLPDTNKGQTHNKIPMKIETVVDAVKYVLSMPVGTFIYKIKIENRPKD